RGDRPAMARRMRGARNRVTALAATILFAIYGFRGVTGAYQGACMSRGKKAIGDGDFALGLSRLQHGVVGFDRFDALLSRAEASLSVYDQRTARAATDPKVATLLEDAARDYLEAAAAGPASGLPLAGLGQVYLRVERSEFESRQVQEAAETTGWADVGRAGRVAVGMFRLAAARNPDSYTFQDQLVFVFLELDLREGAIRTVRDAARIQPFFAAHAWNLATFPRDLVEAFGAEARAALGNAPMLSRDQHLLSLGRIEERLGNLDRAAADLGEALALPTVQIHRSELAYYLA